VRPRGLSLNAKVGLAVTGVFAVILAAFIAALIPFQRAERRRALDRDQRLIEVLRTKYERDLVYDLLSQNRESLVVDLADLARQPGIVWVAVEASRLSVSGTSDPALVTSLLAEAAPPAGDGRPALMLGEGGAALVSEGGRALPIEGPVATDRVPAIHGTPGEHGASLHEVDWPGGGALHYQSDLQAADDVFGRLHIVTSLADLQRAEARTRTLASALAGVTFLASLLLINVLLSRLVVRPVHRVAQAMSRAQAGDLAVRLDVTSHDEVGLMGAAFNEMVAKLGDSQREIEAYSHGLERNVADRTVELLTSEERLRNLSQHLETVIAYAATGVVSTDDAGRIATFNRRAIEILALGGADLVGMTLEQALAGHAHGALLSVVATARESGQSRAQLDLRLPEGRRTVAVVATTLRRGDGERLGMVLVLDDLTEMIASQRLSAWKEAVERVIHEVKNPLTPIALTTEMLRRAFVEDRARFDTMFPSASLRIVSSVQALKTLISEFTQFYRMPRVLLRPQDVNALVTEVVAPYAQAGTAEVRVRCTLAEGLPPAQADSEQLKRVLLNVISNGIEAMAGRPGELTVSTALEAGELVIGVRDQGAGVEDVERLFELYYTTKAKGTGLGLVISRQIVEQHGGTLRITSELGVGTDVRIRLPVVASPAPDR